MGIVTFAVICLILGATFALQEGRERVTNTKKQIPEFLFDCYGTEVNWISPCEAFRSYLMIYDSQGNFFQEKTSNITNMPYLRTTFTKKAKKPTDKDVLQGRGYPNYLFQLEKVNQHPEFYFIATKSEQLLVTGNEVNPSLLLRKDYCSQVFTEQKLIRNTSSSMEIGVTVAPSTAGSTELAVTTVSTDSPITAVSISTPAPNSDYTCDQAHWKLWKDYGRFLLIESVSKPGFFLRVDSRTHKVRMGELGDEEKFTGIRTSFLKNITLERTAGEKEPGIDDNAYGDLVVHYFERNGTQQSGYICDYDWGKKSAQSVCLYLGFKDGIPTYDGVYSNNTTPEYVVSGLNCENENLGECKFRTVCGSDFTCLTQNSMKPFGGKGYACNRGATTDVAGVVCGTEEQITNVQIEKITCNRTSENSDRKSVASMYNLNKQMKKVSSDMFTKHWSEYLLPMPMAVSLMSAILLVSSQNDRVIELVKPNKGQWDHLKYDYLEPNLLDLSQEIKNNFLLAKTNMGDIKWNAYEIHKNMMNAVQYAFSSNEYDYKTNLPRSIELISQDAKNSQERAKEVHTNFTKTASIIDELISGLENTHSYQKNKKVEAEDAIRSLNVTYVANEEDFKKNMLKKQEYDTKVDESRSTYFNAVKKAMTQKCVAGTDVCSNCEWKARTKTDECLNEVKYCKEWDEDFWSADDCEKWDWKCTEYRYIPAGSYCQDRKLRDGPCTKCDWADDVAKNLKNVADFTSRLQDSVMNDDRSYSAVTDAIEDLVSQVGEIDQNVQNYKKGRAASKIVKPINVSSDPISETDSIKKVMLKPLYLTKLSVDMSIDLLNQENIPIAIKSRNYGLEVKRLLESLITRKVKKVEDITGTERVLITALYTKGKKNLNEAKKEEAKHEITLKKKTVSGGISDYKTGELATLHLEYLSKRHKTEKVLESIANQMKNGITEMFRQDFKVQDINSIIIKLTRCSKYLSLLSEQWVVLNEFFTQMSKFLDRQKKRLTRITDVYVTLGIPAQSPDLSTFFKTTLQNDIVEALSSNIYVGRIAAFYTKIADDNGVLEQMARIGLYMNKMDPVTLENSKKYIEDEATRVQDKIKEEVRKEEAKINDEILKDVSSMKNQIACDIVKARNATETSKLLDDHTEINEAEEKNKNIKTATSTVSPEGENTGLYTEGTGNLPLGEPKGQVDISQIPAYPFAV